MTVPDTLSRLTCESISLRAYTATTLRAVREITSLHGTTPNATVALGRTITAAALLSATLRPDSDQNLSLSIQGSGPLREIHVQADGRGNIRGYVANPHPDYTEDLGRIGFSRAIGAGVLMVRKDIGLREPYTGITPLRYGEVAGDIALYLTDSEQVPSAVIIALVLERDGTITSSGGILIQTYPDTTPDTIETVERNVLSARRALGDRLKDGEDIHDILGELVNGAPVTLLDSRPIRAACRCSGTRIRSALEVMAIDELEEMRVRDHGAEVTCTFCTKKYRFTEDDLGVIIESRTRSDDAKLRGARGRTLQ